MLLVSVAGIFAGIVVFFSLNALGSAYIDKRYLRAEAMEKRQDDLYSDFSYYVSSHALSGTDYHAIAVWTEDHPYATILLYGKDHRRVHFSAGKIASGDALSDSAAQDSSLYPLRFADGLYIVSINDSSHLQLAFFITLASVTLGCLCMVVLVMFYAHRLTMRIVSLSHEASEISTGDLSRSICISGSDELSALAASMDNMRQSVIRRMGDENLAWQANTELITAISHDIRTPMTSVIGYLGLLSESGFEDKARCRQFTDAAYSKAIELKHLTDELFSYFLVFGRKTPEMHLEELDGQLLLEQITSEAEYDLRDAGFAVRFLGFHAPCVVSIDTLHFARVINNLISNIKKYADPARQVTFLSELSGGVLSLCVSNYIRLDAPRTESTKIGLMSCCKLMESMGGSFHVVTDDRHFSAELGLPARAADKAQ